MTTLAAENTALKDNLEMVVYRVYTPEDGPEHRIYDDDFIASSGGIHAIEEQLRKESYWFVRVGTIQGEQVNRGIRLKDESVFALPWPAYSECNIGRRNPAFRCPEFERKLFEAVFCCLDAYLQSWNHDVDDGVEHYAVKDVKMNEKLLRLWATELRKHSRMDYWLKFTIFKYWDNVKPSYPSPDLLLDEFPLKVGVELRWNSNTESILAKVLPPKTCLLPFSFDRRTR